MQGKPRAVFLMHLIQDVNVLRPLVFMAARDFGFDTLLLVSVKLAARDRSAIWNKEISEICAATGAQFQSFDDDFMASTHLTGSGVIFSASESHVQEHAVAHKLFRHAPAGFLKVTVQHGFECVGFRHSAEHVRAHGPVASFAADLVCAWQNAEHLSALAPSQQSKLIVTGPTAVLQRRTEASAQLEAPPAGLVCENLHSVRFNTLPHARSEFIATMTQFARSMRRRRRRVVLRSHAGGQYLSRTKMGLPPNVKVANPPLYRLDLHGFAYGISTPSSILVDMLLANIPTAIWRDVQGKVDTSNYDGLVTVSSAQEWMEFARAAELDAQPFLAAQKHFLERQQMLLSPEYVYARFAEIFQAVSRMTVRPAGSRPERERILFVANGNSPTLQLSFQRPLAPLVASGEMSTRLITQRELSEEGLAPDAELNSRTDRYLDDYDPSIIVFCRYSGPGSNRILAWARRQNIPAIYHIDDDLLAVPADIGERKFAMHNAPERLHAVRSLLSSVDLVYASTETLKAQLLDYLPGLPIIAGAIYCGSTVIRRPRRSETCRVGYMASADHSHNLAMVLLAIERLLDWNDQVEFELFGSIPVPDVLLRFGDRVTTSGSIADYESFLRELAKREWDIGICPLVPIDFNLAKANTKWVEYTAAGAAVIASRGTAYDDCCDDGCGILADSVEEWFSALDLLANNVDERLALVNRAQAKLQREFNLTRLRTQVLDVLALAHETVSARSRTGQEEKERLTCQMQ